jgi:probable phosphoglycerate mutase
MTDWNAIKRIQGQTDIPLNKEGIKQALEMSLTTSDFDIAAIYSSCLKRAQATAQKVADIHGLEFNRLAILNERNYGIFQGITAEEGARRYPAAYAHYKARDLEYDFEVGESLRAFAKRVEEAVGLIVSKHNGRSVIAVSHAGVLDVVYRKATGRLLQSPRDFVIPYCALNWFHFDANDVGELSWHLNVWGG